MNKLLTIAGLLLLAGCATDSHSVRGTAVALTPEQSYVHAVTQAARRRGVQVYWMNPPVQEAGPPARR